MKLTIDRNENIIINANGVAHKTGYVAIGFHGMSNKVTLSTGKGFHRTNNNHTIHHTNQTGGSLWEGSRADLTFSLFQSITGWPPAENLTSKRGGIRQGAGAPKKLDTAKARSIRLTDADWLKLKAAGGAKWIREMLYSV